MLPISTVPQLSHRSLSEIVRSSEAARRMPHGLSPSTTVSPWGMTRWISSRSTAPVALISISATTSSPSSARSRLTVSQAFTSGRPSKNSPAATISANGAATTTSSGRRSASAAIRPSAARPRYGTSRREANGVTPRRSRRPRPAASAPARASRARRPRPSAAAPRAPASGAGDVRVPESQLPSRRPG